MNERTRNLFPSLVGSSIEFSFKKKVSNVLSIEKNIISARRKIEADIGAALSVGGKLCVMLIAELTAYYRNEIFYMAVRSAIRMKRYRPMVLEYMQLSPQERADRLRDVLSEKPRGDKNRDLKISALRYFLSIYPSRAKDFKKFLTREEYTIVV